MRLGGGSIRYEINGKIECIKRGIVDLSNFKKRELSSVELNFLMYITRSKDYFDGHISEYWTHECHLNYQDVLEQFVGQNLVEIVELNLFDKMYRLLSVNNLIIILCSKSLSLNGGKADLVTRVIENLSESELEKYDRDRYIRYRMTEKGSQMIQDYHCFINRDTNLRGECFELIFGGNIKEACIK